MAGDEGDDGLFLNLALPEAPAPHVSRTQQRKQSWTQQRAAKKLAHKHGDAGGGRGRGRPNWLGGGQQQQAAEGQGGGSGGGGSGSAGQLKGYSLGGDAPAATAAVAPAAAPAAEPKPQRQKPRQQEQRQQGDDGHFAFGFGGQSQPAHGRQQHQAPPQTQRQRPQQQPAQRPQHDGQQSRAAYQQQQSDKPRQQVVAQARSCTELAKAHFERRQARHAPKQQQQPRQQQQERDASPQPPSGAAAAGGAATGANRGGGGAAAGDNGERPSKRIGRLRLASRQAGYREATPDLDDVKAAGSDAESDDVLAAVAAVVARDKQVQAELAGEARQRFARYASSDSEGEAAGGVTAGRRRGGGTAANGSGLAANVACFAGSSDEEGEDGPAGIVEFGGGDGGSAERRAAKRRKRDRADGAAAAAGGASSKRPKAAAVSVRPGELVHAGAVGGNAAGAAAQDGEDGFAALGLSSQLADHLAAHGFAAPTGVQRQSIPVLLGRRDALINAPTGSGKTLSYLAPIVADLAAQQPAITRAQGTFAVVICPTRELCLQVADVLTMLVRRFVWLVGGAIHGGEDRGKEKARLRKGVTVLVATPGRLLDHLQNTKAFRTEELRWLVLDEADRLLDLGFEKKIAEVCTLLDARSAEADYAQRRTTALLSATLHSRLGSLASLSLKDPAAIGFEYDLVDGKMVVRKVPAQQAQQAQQQAAAGGGDAAAWAAATAAAGGAAGAAAALEQFEIPAQLKQRFVEVPCKLRLVALAALLRARLAAAPASCKMVVFLSTTDSVEFYHSVFAEAWEAATGERLLQASGAPILKLHGNMPQSERTAAFLAFTKAPAGVLLCTDVAARGLDFPAVTDIVQFDPPGEAAEYVHRVGRTARLGQRGDAVLFLLPSERGYVQHLQAHGVALREQPVVPLLNHVLGADRKAGIDLPVERHQGAYALQKQLMEAVAADRHLTALGGDAFRSWVRAYATHAVVVKEVFHVRRLHLGHVAHAFALKERPTLVGKSAAKASAQQKRKASHSQRGGGGGGKRPKGSSGSGKSGGGKSGGRKQPRKAAAQVVGGKGTMYNLA